MGGRNTRNPERSRSIEVREGEHPWLHWDPLQKHNSSWLQLKVPTSLGPVSTDPLGGREPRSPSVLLLLLIRETKHCLSESKSALL